MLTSRVIPCLDVQSDRVVKGVRFSELRDAGAPAALAEAYQQQGADELVLLDVAATNEDRRTRVETVKNVRDKLSIPLTVGGGVRDVDDVKTLLDAGADRVSVNSAAVLDPILLSRLSEHFGCQCVVVAIDAAKRADGGFEVLTHSGRRRTGRDAVEWARECERLGAGEVLLTSFDRDGTRSGYDLELLELLCGAVRIPVVASGGAASPQHLLEALQVGASAVLAASIFHDGEYTVREVKHYLARNGVHVRI